MTSLIAELRLAVRRFIAEPGFTIPAVATMAIGIGIAASVFALVEGVLMRPLPYPDSGRLVSVRHVAPGIELTRDRVSAGMFLHYRDGNRVFEGLGAYEERSYTLTDRGGSARIRAALVSPELFSVLQVAPHLGRVPTASDHNLDHETGTGTTGALLSHDLWVRRYGADPEVIGRTIEVDGEPFVVVVGVAPEGFSFPDQETEAWLVVPQEQLPWSASATVHQGMYLGAVGRLRPGVTPEEAEVDLNRLVRVLPEAFPDITAEEISDLGLRAVVKPFKDEIVGDIRLTLLLVLASGGFLLLVTWANVANLMLLRTHRRRAEIGLTRALGASERNVARRLLSESLVLTLTGGLLGLGLAYLAIEARFGLTSQQIPRLDGVGVNAIVIGVVAMLASISGFVMAAICLASTRQSVAGPALTGAALFLGVVGIYGVLAYAVRRRTAEIGIRIALGASPRRVARLIVLQGAVLSAAGIAAGLAAALLLTRFMAALLYETSTTDPMTFAVMTLLLFGVALVASYLPAGRASRVDPAQALRAE